MRISAGSTTPKARTCSANPWIASLICGVLPTTGGRGRRLRDAVVAGVGLCLRQCLADIALGGVGNRLGTRRPGKIMQYLRIRPLRFAATRAAIVPPADRCGTCGLVVLFTVSRQPDVFDDDASQPLRHVHLGAPRLDVARGRRMAFRGFWPM